MASQVWMRSVVPLAAADLRHRYAGSLLGALWAVLGPLVEVAAYALVFGLLVRPRTTEEGLTYALFVASGLLPWASLRESLEGASAALTDNRWIRRSRVPMEVLVARQVLVSSTRAAVGLILVLAVLVATRPWPGWWGVVLPLLGLSLQAVGAYGAGLALAPVATLHPDLRPALSSALTLLTFASPIVYPESFLSGGVLAAMEWNPFTHLLRLYRIPLAPFEVGGLDLAVSLSFPLALVAFGGLLKRRLWFPARDRL